MDEEYIFNKIGAAAAYEQLAEECAELGQMALKMSRALRQENPTPLTRSEIFKSLIEEVSDVSLVLDVVNVCPDNEIKSRKLKRWKHRVG